jgi:CAP-Gly domain-containing linker protein 1
VKHLQNKLNHLEEELEEARLQAETDIESWKAKLAKSRDVEKVVIEQGSNLKAEISKLKEQANGAKGRIGELEGALKENQAALEGARAEIEGLRVEAAVGDQAKGSVLADALIGSFKYAGRTPDSYRNREGSIRK